MGRGTLIPTTADDEDWTLSLIGEWDPCILRSGFVVRPSCSVGMLWHLPDCWHEDSFERQ